MRYILIISLFFSITLLKAQNLFSPPSGKGNTAVIQGRANSEVWYSGDWNKAVNDLKLSALIKQPKGNYYIVNMDSTVYPMWLSRLNKPAQGNSTSMNLYSTLAHFGGGDWGLGTKHGISFGYKNGTYVSEYMPVWIGADMTLTDGRTAADFIVATRKNANNEEPTVNFRVTRLGIIKGNMDYVPQSGDDLTNKKYVDTKIPDPPAKGSYTLQSVDGVVSWIDK